MEKLGEILSRETTNDYVSILTLPILPFVNKLSVCLKEMGVGGFSEDCLYSILGSMNGVDFDYEISVDQALDAGTIVYETATGNPKLSEPMLFVQVLIKSAVAETPGIVSCWVAGC